MSELNVLVYGNPMLFKQIFNAVALSMGGSAYASLIKLALLFSVMSVTMQYVKSQQVRVFPQHFFQYFVIFNLCFSPKITVLINDQLNPTHIISVESVPAGVAVLAWATTHIGSAMTALVEQNFSLPDDLHYNTSGFLMASALLRQADTFQSTDPAFSAALESFVHQCVFYDLLLERYTLKELETTDNLWHFLSSKASEARSFNYQGKIITCKDGAASLTQDWAKVTGDALTHYNARLFFGLEPSKKGAGSLGDDKSATPQAGVASGRSSPQLKNLLESYLPISYSYLAGVSKTASAIMQQNILLNAFKKGAIDFSSSVVGGTQALSALAFAKAQQQKRLSNTTAGMMAAYWLPLMKNVFEALLYGSFLFVFLLALLPGGFSVLKNYGMGLMWLQLWPPLFAILNLIMNMTAQAKTLGAGGGLTLASMGGAMQVNADIAGLAGYLAGSVPLISYYLLRFGAYTLTQIAGQMSGVLQGAAMNAAHEAVSGNLSLGNMNLGNESAWNHNSHKINLNADYKGNSLSIDDQDGNQLLQTSSGKMFANINVSQIPLNIDLSQITRHELAKQKSHAMSALLNHRDSFIKTQTALIQNVVDLSEHVADGENDVEGWVSTDSASARLALDDVHRKIQTLADSNNISFTDARNLVGSVAARAGFGAKLPSDIPIKASFGVNADTKMGTEYSAKSEQAYRDAEELIRNKNFTKDLTIVKAGLKENAFRATTEAGKRLVHNAHANYNEALQSSHSVNADINRSKSFLEQISTMESQQSSISQSLKQPFLEYLAHQKNPDGSGELDINGAKDLLGRTDTKSLDRVHKFAEQFVQEQIATRLSRPNNLNVEKTKQAIQDDYKAFVRNNEGEAKVFSKAKQNADYVNYRGDFLIEKRPDRHIKAQVDHFIDNDKRKINQGREDLRQDFDKTSKDIVDDAK